MLFWIQSPLCPNFSNRNLTLHRPKPLIPINGFSLVRCSTVQTSDKTFFFMQSVSRNSTFLCQSDNKWIIGATAALEGLFWSVFHFKSASQLQNPVRTKKGIILPTLNL
ncbi:hypothetical protein VNO77_33211 [Canavalia gladiata]|uniref:Uncharacterized protein n=1 Tax=Canavalia gladiata TaxID=3824 RepID=A0AAN9KCX6_CANGL